MGIEEDFDQAVALARQTGNSELFDLISDLMAQTYLVLHGRLQQGTAIQMLSDDVERVSGSHTRNLLWPQAIFCCVIVGWLRTG